MKKTTTALLTLAATVAMAQNPVMQTCFSGEPYIIFGTPVDAKAIMKIANTAEVKTLQMWDEGRDKRCSYHFADLGEDMPFRVCAWEQIKQMPIFISEGTRAGASLQSSRDLRDFAEQYGLNYQYKEMDGDHGEMWPMILPDVFDFFNQHK